MAESGQSSDPAPKNPVRVVYHTQNRTFARLFKERSLEQVKDVVRRKLGLGSEVDVSLKQMGSDALLDLDDDDDFQAFRVLVRSSVSVDIQVTVGGSRSTSVPPPVSPQSREQPSAPSESLGQGTALPKAPSVTESSPATKKTKGSARKRKVSFGDTAVASPDKHTERHTRSEPAIATPASSVKSAETFAAAKSADAEEPPKKKQKKDVTKASSRIKSRAKESTAPDHGSEGLDGEPSGLSAKKSKKYIRDDAPVPEKSSAFPDADGVDQPTSQPDPVNDTNSRPPSEGRKISVSEGRVLKSHQNKKKIGVCAAIPQTSASAHVQSELVAAILALSKGSEFVPPRPPAKRKAAKKDTKKSSASSGVSLSISATADAPSNGTSNVSTEQRHKHTIATNESLSQTRELHGPLCPICLGEPFHIRYSCPTFRKGPGALRKRLDEVKKSNVGDQQSLIKELEDLIRVAEATSEFPPNATPPRESQSQGALQPLNASVSHTPNIPSHSNLSEVTVEDRDEGSSSESSDDMPEGRNERNQEPLAPMKHKTLDKQPRPPNDDLKAVVHGPTLRRQSIQHVLDRIAGDEGEKHSESDSEDDDVELEEDPEREVDRSSRLPKRIASSSSSEAEAEESVSPSPSLPAKVNPIPSIQDSNNQVEKLSEHPNSDVAMGGVVAPPVLQDPDGDSSEETHVGSEDRMAVDHTVGDKGVVAIVEEQLPSPSRTSFPRPFDNPDKELQGPGEAEVDATTDGSAMASSRVEADPIEPPDGLEPATTSRASNSDPIETLPEDGGPLSNSITESTRKPGVAKRIKNRDGQILNDEAEHPISVEELASLIAEEVTPLSTKGKSRKKATETPAVQGRSSTRRRTRSGSLLSTSTPAAVALLNHKAKIGARPAKRSDTDGSQGNDVRSESRTAPSPAVWETLAEPSSPSQQLDEPLVYVDELMSSSPQPEDATSLGRLNVKEKKIAPRTPALSNGAKTSREKERLFDLTSSQIPFPYSQHKAKPAPAFPNEEQEVATDSESGSEARVKAIKKKAGPSAAAYRPLSQLASQAVRFTPSLPTPTNKSVTGTRTKKRAADKDPSSSSSSSEDEANKSVHIPRGQRAGATLRTKKRKSLLSRV